MVRVLEIIGKRPVGGVGTVLLNYQKFIDTEKIHMDYLIFGEQPEAFDQTVQSMGSAVYCYPALSGRQMGQTRKYMEEFLQEHAAEYDVIHLHAPTIAFLVYPVTKKYQKPLIIHSHATLYAENKIKAIRNRILWKLFTLQDKHGETTFIGCSDAAGKFLFGEKPYIVLKNAIEKTPYLYDDTVRQEIRTRYGVQNALVVGNIGRMSLQKNQTYLIDIFAEIKKQHSDSVLWLVGDGETRPEVERKVREAHLENDVKFFGMVDNARELYQAMDVMVMPSLFEGLPMVGVEAQASGLPCVFSDAITREVDIAEAAYLSLDDTIQQWARVAIGAGTRYQQTATKSITQHQQEATESATPYQQTATKSITQHRQEASESATQRQQELAGSSNSTRHSYSEKLDSLGFNIELEARRLEEIYSRVSQQ